MTDEKKLREKMRDSGFKSTFIAKHINLTYQGFLNKLTNKSQFNVAEIVGLCDLLGINAEERESIFFNS